MCQVVSPCEVAVEAVKVEVVVIVIPAVIATKAAWFLAAAATTTAGCRVDWAKDWAKAKTTVYKLHVLQGKGRA